MNLQQARQSLSLGYNNEPVCAMVLANGQYRFTCSGDGSYEMTVPLDESGIVTLHAFCSGMSPYKTAFSSNFTTNYVKASTIFSPSGTEAAGVCLQWEGLAKEWIVFYRLSGTEKWIEHGVSNTSKYDIYNLDMSKSHDFYVAIPGKDLNPNYENSLISWKSEILRINIVATQQSMDEGEFQIIFNENDTKGLKTRELTFEHFTTHGQYINPFIDPSHGEFKVSEQINYTFNKTTNLAYGYTVKPPNDVFGAGICHSDIAVLDIIFMLPLFIWDDPIKSFRDKSDILVFFDIPEGMEIYTPWENIEGSDRIFHIKKNANGWEFLDDVVFATWGNYTSVKKIEVDNHNFHMLGYNTNTDHIFDLMEFTFPYMMQAFKFNMDLLPKSTTALLLPDIGVIYGGEGRKGGYYSPNWGGEDFIPIFEYDGYITDCGGYYNHTPNMNWLSGNGIHALAHSTLSYLGHWAIEGVAIYYQYDLMNKKGIISESHMVLELKEHIKYYQEIILPEKKDHPLLDLKSQAFEDECHAGWMSTKGALVLYAIDRYINLYTNNRKALIDSWQLFIKNLTNGIYFGNDYEVYIFSLKQLTGKDFTEFFDKYVFNCEPLPFKIDGEKVILTYFPPSN